MNVAERIKSLREAAGLSKGKLAERAELSATYIGQLEMGIKQPTVETITRICTALGITLAEFFSDNGQPQELPPEVRRVCDKVQKLPPDKLKILESVLDTWVESD